MISINDLTVAFGGFTLLDDINFHISDGEHLALVGKNGAGKSTILKLIMGLESPSSGRIMKPKDLTIGYLPQIMEYSKDKSVIEETMTAFSDMFALNDRLDAINAEIASRTDYESAAYRKLLVELTDINDRLSIIGNESPKLQAEKTLIGLGFKREELSRTRNTFSQGWNMRIELAKVLLHHPQVILLDEPTNHLDIESIQWLEDYLHSFSGTLVLISHDRRFLDRVTTRTVEILLGHINDYKVPYSQYIALRKERLAQQKAAYDNQQRMIEKTEDFIARFRYKPTKSNQVQSRIKQLEKIERIEVDEEDNSALTVKFPPSPRSGNVVFQTKELSGGYTSPKEKVVFKNANIVIERGEKVAFVGRNGEGKSTMVKTIIGELQPISGSATLGYNVALGYYAQNQEDILDKNDTVFETLDKIAVGDVRFRLRDILGAFLFKGEDIDKKVAVLSGGERSRLAMAKLILKPYNLLALDEPTNHMDIRSKDVLKQALMKYDGTLVIVSHDRDFMDGLVNKVYEFKDGKIKEHLGGIQEFLESRKIESLRDLEVPVQKGAADRKEEAAKQTAAPKNAPLPKAKEAPKPQEKKLSFEEQKEARRRKQRLDAAEKKIAELEGAMKEIETKLSAPAAGVDIDTLTRKYLELKRELDMRMDEWMAMGSE